MLTFLRFLEEINCMERILMNSGTTSEEIKVKQAFDKMAKDIQDEKFYMSWIDNLDIDVKWVKQCLCFDCLLFYLMGILLYIGLF